MELKDKAVKISGKDYILVKDRIAYFKENYPNGAILVNLLTPPENDYIVFKAAVIPDVSNQSRMFVGHSQATFGEGMVNKTAALENAETSAVGRALGMMGIGVIDSIASADELRKAGVGDAEPKAKKTIDDMF